MEFKTSKIKKKLPMYLDYMNKHKTLRYPADKLIIQKMVDEMNAEAEAVQK